MPDSPTGMGVLVRAGAEEEGEREGGKSNGEVVLVCWRMGEWVGKIPVIPMRELGGGFCPETTAWG